MRSIFLIFMLLSVVGNARAQEAPADDFIASPNLRTASLSLYAENLSTGNVIVDHNSQLCLAPASVCKIMPTFIALETFGPNKTFTTELAYSGQISANGTLNGNVYIIGGGDPCLGSPAFDKFYNLPVPLLQKWTDAVKKIGIKHINGDIVCDASLFGQKHIPGKWLWEDIANHFGNYGSAICYRDNIFEIHFKTDAADSSQTHIIEVVPNDLELTLNNEVIASKTVWDEAYIFFTRQDNVLDIRGSLAANQNDIAIKGAMPNPELYLARSFANTLKINGIDIAGKTKVIYSDTAAVATTTIHVTRSPRLADIVARTNIKSMNLYAQVLSYHLEKAASKPYCDLLVDFWTNKGIDMYGVHIDDACGLSRFNTASARQITQMLKYIRQKSKYSDDFFFSLPITGINGTLAKYCVGTCAKNKVHAKSGSMSGVKAFAGYVVNKNNQEIAFCFIVNNYVCKNYKLRKLFENLFVNIVNLE